MADEDRRDRFQAPAPGWYLLLDGGVVVLTVLTFSARARAAAAGRWPVVPLAALRALLIGTVAVHLGEAAWAAHIVRREGLHRSGRRWVAHAFVVGFPALRALHRQIRR